jgi:hypothetical protein
MEVAMIAHEQKPDAGAIGLTRLSRAAAGAGFLLACYAILRLHFLSSDPPIASAWPALAAVAAVLAVQFWLALRWNSPFLAGLAIAEALFSSLVTDVAAIGFPVMFAAAVVAAVLAVRRDWWPLLAGTVVFVYGTNLIWLLNNPVAGNPVGTILPERYFPAALFACAAVFCWPALIRDPGTQPSALTVVLLNCIGLSMQASLAVFALYDGASPGMYSALAAFFLVSSVIQWQRTHRQLESALYACAGYLALSMAIYDYRGTATVFFWLAVQSLVVISMALWFRSKILVVTNCVIFLCILGAYMTGFPSSNGVTFAFALVAHLSARLMNWQKERLTLRTEALRNVYLVTGFVLVLYALRHAVPQAFVALSWICAGAVYFAVGAALKNRKYRYLTIASVVAAMGYATVCDMPRLMPDHQGIAMVMGVAAMLAATLFYAKLRQRRQV